MMELFHVTSKISSQKALRQNFDTKFGIYKKYTNLKYSYSQARLQLYR